MSDKYKIIDQNSPYFLAMTVVGWIDLFTRKELKLLIVDSLKYCQKRLPVQFSQELCRYGFFDGSCC